MTINMTLSTITHEKNALLLPPGSVMSSKVEEWVDEQTKGGTAATSLLASVEIIGAGKYILCAHLI